MDTNTALNISSLALDKGIATVMATIIGSIIGALISIYLARKNFDKQRQLIQEQLAYQNKQFKIEQDMKIKLLNLEHSNRNKNEIRSHLENTYELLSTIKSKCSITSSFISTEIETLESFHKFYLDEIVNRINKIEMNVGLYFPNLKKQIDDIAKQANLFWGYQQQYLRQLKDGNFNKDDLNKEIVAANEISSLASSMQYNLKKEFNNTFCLKNQNN